jgi:hypothetical protein
MLPSLISGASINSPTEPQSQPVSLSQADLFPSRGQKIADIEGRHAVYSSLQFPLDTGKYFMRMDHYNYTRGTASESVLDVQGSIKLPLPQQLIDNHAVNYEQQELGSLMGGAADAASKEWNSQGGTSQNISQMLKNLTGADAVGAIGLGIADAFTNDRASTILQLATGLAPNQFLTIMLKGPQYKKHEFTWKLSPRNSQESIQIKQIIAELNNSMAPSSSGSSYFFKFPKVFKISFSPNEQMLFKFKPAVIENMTVNYSPSGIPAFYHGTGAPDAVELRLSFIELEFWLSGDFS